MKALKITGILLIFVGLIAYFTSDYFIEKRLRSELSILIQKDSVSLYKYDFSKFNLSLVDGSIKLKKVTLYPTKAARDSLANPNNNIRVLIEASIEEIKMEGFQIKKFLETGHINITRFKIKKPKVTYLFDSRKKGTSSSTALDNVFSESFSQADLTYFLIDDASIHVHNILKDKDIVVFDNFEFKLSHAHIDSTTIKRFSPFDYDNINFSAKNLTLDLDEDYTFSGGKLSFSAKRNTTSISDLKVSPKYSRENFANKYKFQKTWLALALNDLTITNIDFEELIQNGNFRIGKLELEKANLAIYKDKTKPEPPFKKKFLPVTALKKASLILSIDTIDLKKSNVTINEKSALTDELSELTINNLDAQIYGFTNDSTQMSINKFMTVNVSSRLMKVAPVTLQAKFDLTSSDDRHYIHATVGKTDATIFNKMLNPLLLVKVKSGEILNMDLSYTADDLSCEGTMDFEYENFKIDIYNTEEQDKKQGLLSLAANTVIKTSNTKESSSYTQGVIKADRVQNKFIFPYLWNAVQSGIVYTMAPIMSDIKKQEKASRKNIRKN